MMTPIDDFLAKNLAVPQRFVTEKGGGVVTACDPSYFPGFQLLYTSLALTHEDLPILLWDLGGKLTTRQLEWCQKKRNLTVKVIEEGRLLQSDPIKWLTWNKPLLMARPLFPKNLWLDADCIVRASLQPIFHHLERQPFLLTNPWHYPNLSPLKRYFPIKPGQDDFNLTAAVVGFKQGRALDDRLVDSWADITAVVLTHKDELFSFVSNGDEGTLRMAIQRHDAVSLIWPDQHWCWQMPLEHRLNNIYKDLAGFHYRHPEHYVVHYPTRPKMWEDMNTDFLELS